MVAAADAAAEAMGVRLERRATEVAPWHPGRCAELVVNGHVVGFSGEVHPTVCQAFGLPPRTSAMELDLDQLLSAAPESGVLMPLSTRPVAKEDVALIVDEAMPASEVRAALVEGAGDLLESIALFDIYRGSQIGEGKKSLAFSFRFRAHDRTLTDADTAAARDAAVAVAAARCGAIQRA